MKHIESKNLFAQSILKSDILDTAERCEPEGVWCKSAKHGRNYIDIPPERVTAKRRALRARLDAKRTAPPITADGFLHRSDALRRAFADAVPFAEDDTLTLYALVRVLFEQNLVSLDDIKG